ncbi:MAG: hypothetical protein MAG581_00547 [Deltaproteobacteria bacterium]|jgi:2-polyprenyl-3-methyl-5-hydroxy-6-metoxy-1,4-benzoquinol methylase|nr:hypothetical protein [Deltaproteobacteria bacterium]
MVGYGKEYQKGLNIFGEQFSEIVEFFENYLKDRSAVLDLGCGQGRDTLFFARKGHTVLGIDAANKK